MAWAALIIAGLLEVVGAVGLKYTEGFTRAGYELLVMAAFAASFYLLSAAAEMLPIGTAYAVWTGIGAGGTAVFGMLSMKEPCNPLRLASLALVVSWLHRHEGFQLKCGRTMAFPASIKAPHMGSNDSYWHEGSVRCGTADRQLP